MDAGKPSSANYVDCRLFHFVVEAVLLGSICLVGFVGNTVGYIVLWNEKIRTSQTFLLQALFISDLALIWTLFLGDVMPHLEYVIPILEGCQQVCHYIKVITGPLLFLSQATGIWLTLATGVCRQQMLSSPLNATMGTVSFAKKIVLLILIGALLLTLPQTFDSSIIFQTNQPHNGRYQQYETLAENYWYRKIFLYGIITVAVYIIPLVALAVVATKLGLILRSIHHLRRALAPSFKAQNTDMTRVILCISLMCFLCYLPTTVREVILWASPKPISQTCGHLVSYLSSFAKLFIAVNSATKLLLLCLFAKHFCEAFKDTFCCRRKTTENHLYKCQDASEMTLMSQVDTRT